MDAIELERAKEWVEEFGFWHPGAPVLRPAMLNYDTKDRKTVIEGAVSRAVGRIEERARHLGQGLPFAAKSKTAIMELTDCSMFPKVED